MYREVQIYLKHSNHVERPTKIDNMKNIIKKHTLCDQ